MQNRNRGRVGRKRLTAALKNVFGAKEDAEDLVSAVAGRYNTSGVKELVISGFTDFIWIRLRGQTSEVARAFNDTVTATWGMPILVKRDKLNPQYYIVVRRDTGKLPDWGGSSNIGKHGNQHSFAEPSTAGRDVTFIFKRQIMQPLLTHPQSTPDMTVYVETDLYIWNGTVVMFDGGSSPDMTANVPGTGLGRFVTVYLDGATNTILTSVGSTFDNSFPANDLWTYIPEVAQETGIMLAAVYLNENTTVINWENLYDLRNFLGTGGTPSAVDDAIALAILGW